MKRFAIVAAALALPLGGCAAIGGMALSSLVNATAPAAAVGNKVVIEGTRSLILAHNAYQGAVAVVTPLVNADAFDANQLTMIQSLSDNAVKLLDGADATLTEAQRAAAVFTIASQLNQVAAAARSN